MKKSGKADASPFGGPLSAESREAENIALAVELAGQQLREGTASAQVITHYLKLATADRELERERMRAEVALAQAKVERLRLQQQHESDARSALEAFKRYAGQAGDTDDQDIQ